MVITVVGAGVSGLTSGVELLRAGHDVSIVTRDVPAQTTSAVAAAIWYPYRAYPEDEVLAWGKVSLDRFIELAADSEVAVTVSSALELFPEPAPDPWWVSAVRDFQRAVPEDLVPGYVDGWRLETVTIESPAYLAWLAATFQDEGGRMTFGEVASLDDVPGDVVVNCAGVFAGAITADEDVFPIRGQVVRMTNPGLTESVLVEHGPLALTYVVPRSSDVVIGGTAEDGAWALEVDPAAIEAMLERALVLVPRLAEAEVLGTAVGLRPGRSRVRVERKGRVIHNYGHGGSGYSLSWGCAAEVVTLAG